MNRISWSLMFSLLLAGSSATAQDAPDEASTPPETRGIANSLLGGERRSVEETRPLTLGDVPPSGEPSASAAPRAARTVNLPLGEDPVVEKPAREDAPRVAKRSARKTEKARPSSPKGGNPGLRAISAIKSRTLRNPNGPDPHGWGTWCRALVRAAFQKATGRAMPELSAGTAAWDSYRAFAREGRVQSEGVPPAGAIVFWSPAERGRVSPGSPGATAGHIAISNGDGTVITNVKKGGRRDNLGQGIALSVPISCFGHPAGYVVIPGR
jgi:hypothetical protein